MIDLLLSGTPCQGFSTAGKGLNFKDPRSSLFFEFVKALKDLKPKYFLFENVKMKKEWEDIISNQLGVKPILINSSLLSAQSRKRLYWTNIPGVQQPQDKHIAVNDILEDLSLCDRNKSYCIDAHYFHGGNMEQYLQRKRRQLAFIPLKKEVAEEVAGEKTGEKTEEVAGENKINIFTLPHGFIKEKTQEGIKYPTLCAQDPSSKHLLTIKLGYINKNAQGQKVYSIKGKSVSLCSNGGGLGGKTGLYKIDLPDGKYIIRKLSPIECERLQTLPDNYTAGISNSQRYKCIGNGWTVDIISHILSYIPETTFDEVVSICDGISCGQVALKKAGKTYNRYYASEIDKYAIKVTMSNFPDTKQLGDVTKINWSELFLKK